MQKTCLGSKTYLEVFVLFMQTLLSWNSHPKCKDCECDCFEIGIVFQTYIVEWLFVCFFSGVMTCHWILACKMLSNILFIMRVGMSITCKILQMSPPPTTMSASKFSYFACPSVSKTISLPRWSRVEHKELISKVNSRVYLSARRYGKWVKRI